MMIDQDLLTLPSRVTNSPIHIILLSIPEFYDKTIIISLVVLRRKRNYRVFCKVQSYRMIYYSKVDCWDPEEANFISSVLHPPFVNVHFFALLRRKRCVDSIPKDDIWPSWFLMDDDQQNVGLGINRLPKSMMEACDNVMVRNQTIQTFGSDP